MYLLKQSQYHGGGMGLQYPERPNFRVHLRRVGKTAGSESAGSLL